MPKTLARTTPLLVAAWLAGLASAASAQPVTVGWARGVPRLLIGGHPTPATMFFNTSWQPEVVADSVAEAFARAGIHLHQFDVNLDWSDDFEDVPVEPYRSLDTRLGALAGIDPEARALLRVHLFAPAAWYETHPDEILAAEDGTRIETGRLSAATSYASRLWREEAGERLAALARHVRESSLGKHVLGYLLFAGWSGEWNWWKPPRGDLPGAEYARLANMCTDHSPAMARAFREWLREAYGDDEGALRAAWRADAASFDEATVPTEAEVSEALAHQLNDPRQARRVADYFRCNAHQVASTLLHFARVARQADGDRLVGAFFGEFLFLAIGGNRETLRVGHLEIDRVLRSPDIDFICSPQCYQARAPGGSAPSMCLVASARKHRKLVWYEYDQPTHLASERFRGRSDTPADLAQTQAVMRRGFAYALCNGLGIWWWDQESRCTDAVAGGVWYRGEEVQREFAAYQQIALEALSRDRASVAEVAVLYDPWSALWQSCTWSDLTKRLIYSQVDELGRMGAPYDLYSLADIDSVTRRYKLVIVLNAFYLDDEQYRALSRLVARPGTSVLFFYAPGYLSEAGTSLERMSRLLGMKMEQVADEVTGEMAEIDRPDEPFGRGGKLAPAFAVDDVDAEPIATYRGRHEIAAASRRKGPGRVYYFASGPLPAGLLREIARESGCHIYCESDDPVYVCRDYIAIHAGSAGNRTITLPAPRHVVSLYDARQDLGTLTHIEAAFDGPGTRLYGLDEPG